MAIVSKGEYNVTRPTLGDNQYANLQLDSDGILLIREVPLSPLPTPVLLAGASSTTGKIGTVPAGETLAVVLDCTATPVTFVDWYVACDKAWSYQLGRSNSNPLSGTLTLADAAPVDDGDTFVLNGLTFTAEATEGDASAAARKYYLGDDNAAASVNLTALLNNATYGVPGFTFSVAAVAATDVITAVGTSATTLQFAQDGSDAVEIAFSSTTKTKVNVQSALITGKTSTAAWAAETITEHYIDGWGYAVFFITNNGVDAATITVQGTRN